MLQGLNPPLRRPPLSRNPYRPLPRELKAPFAPKGQVTETCPLPSTSLSRVF
ncbi:hypothetical protein PCANC_28069 [Puccinia coronata f. sp. avenae]|uniref:Uncharacterized protein n=1 Tax=Puccinia coronata f. sp. avenae TaxID=200324 RepID=A0A2N5S0E4_9BASI|nr:hypothetical protein PCANC_28069 [Puccinia coronata f. sp. avenae]